jgi:hypothetical protein
MHTATYEQELYKLNMCNRTIAQRPEITWHQSKYTLRARIAVHIGETLHSCCTAVQIDTNAMSKTTASYN